MVTSASSSFLQICAPTNQVFANLTDPSKAAALYWGHGFVAIPTDANTGTPRVKWGAKKLDREGVLSKFDAGTNVALVCGQTSAALVDIDLDEDIAVKLASSFLPNSHCVFGRESRPSTHHLYCAPGELANYSFNAPQKFGLRPFVEILACKHLVTVPPSIHPKDEKKVRFEPGKAGLPTTVSAQTLHRCASLLAVTCLVSTVWPKTSGSRHHLALVLAGALLRSDLEPEEVRKILFLASREAGDGEFEDRAVAVDDTAVKQAAGKHFTGWPTLSDELGTNGQPIVETLQKWLLVSEMKPETPSLAGLVVSAKALIASHVPARPNIITPWLKEGSVVLVYAQAKVGKTWFCLELAIGVADGRNFLEYAVIGKRPVLYIDAEMSQGEKKERLDKLTGGTDQLLILDAHVFAQKFDRPLNLSHDDCQRAVSELVEEQGVKLVVVDTLSSLAPRRDENDNASPELQSLMRWARALKARGVSVVLVHHAGHEGKHARGSSALTDFVDTVIALRKRDDDGLVEIENGSVVLVYAQAKVGKTWFCLELAIGVADGRNFLEYAVIGKRPVLYIDAEMSQGEKKERLDKLTGGTDQLLILDAHVFAQKFDRPLNLSHDDCQRAVSELVEEQGVELVVIDTLSSLAPRRDENDNASPELRSLMRWTQGLKALGVSVVFVHHAGHEGKHARGASALPGFVDTVIALRKRDDDGLVEMAFTHTRDRKPDPDKLLFKINDGGDVVTLDVVKASKPHPEHKLLPHLYTGKHLTQAELATATGKSKGTISGWISKLRVQGLVEKGTLKLTANGKKLAKDMG